MSSSTSTHGAAFRAARLLMTSTAALLLACNDTPASIRPWAERRLDLIEVASGLSQPVHLTAPAGDARLFIVEKTGRIRVVKVGQLLATPFLDLSARVSTAGEDGLLSMAFDPAFATNGRVYAYFIDRGGDIAIERFAVAAGADVADAASATRVISIPHPGQTNHNGGLVAFGPDGMLYLATGDGGGGGDPAGNAQNLNVLLGKMLRLDVRTLPYTVPASNPFVGQTGRRSEIWAYGLRNPWRFDFGTGANPMLYIADVGQGAQEEINVVRADSAGVNYGWNVLEGTRCFSPTVGCDPQGKRAPAVVYGRDEGCSIIGGHVYRGAIQALRGHYVYSDYCSGWIRTLSGTAPTSLVTAEWYPRSPTQVLGFGEDAAGEQYVMSGTAGIVYRIVAAP
jgi:glucose/arabinose dehydrogenase